MERKSRLESLEVKYMFNINKNKKVLVTGHTGFKGYWLTLWLLKLGADVAGYALVPKTDRENFVLGELKNKKKDYLSGIKM